MRINKLMSNAGWCSRKEANAWIEEGRITVNGALCTKGQWVEWGEDIRLDGVSVVPMEKICIAFHKPQGIVCTYDSLVEGNLRSYLNLKDYVFPVGRLDKESSGLLLLTNDGDLAQQLLSPGSAYEKKYRVKVHRPLEEKFLSSLRGGMEIFGHNTLPAVVEVLGEKEFFIVLTEGKNRQIRKMCKKHGYAVLELHRISFAGVPLLALAPGAWRKMAQEEVGALWGKAEEDAKDISNGQELFTDC